MAQMPHAKQWERVLGNSVSSEKASELIDRARTYYKELLAVYSSEKNRKNYNALKTRILPGLSLYKTLLETYQDQQTALAQAEVLFRAAFFSNISKGVQAINFLPNPFLIIRPYLKTITRNPYLPDAQEVVIDTPDCFAINIYRCFIFDILKENDAAELTILFCKTDDWLMQNLPKVRWERTKTLGQGHDCCDFRWTRTAD